MRRYIPVHLALLIVLIAGCATPPPPPGPNEKVVVTTKRVPILGSLPLLGRLFRSSHVERLPVADTVVPVSDSRLATAPIEETPKIGSPVLQRWALVVGISKYKDTNVPRLQYASADAKAFQQWLVSPSGGAYDPNHIKLLCDEQATSAAIRDALFNWLKQPIEEDLVTIYYAGHGSPESPDNLKNLFLLPHDVDYSKIGSTGFPMWDIETS